MCMTMLLTTCLNFEEWWDVTISSEVHYDAKYILFPCSNFQACRVSTTVLIYAFLTMSFFFSFFFSLLFFFCIILHMGNRNTKKNLIMWSNILKYVPDHWSIHARQGGEDIIIMGGKNFHDKWY